MFYELFEFPLFYTTPVKNLINICFYVAVDFSRSMNQFSVDCASAYKGLFIGIVLSVITIMSLIMFFELIYLPGYSYAAVIQVIRSYFLEIIESDRMIFLGEHFRVRSFLLRHCRYIDLDG